MKKLFVSIIFFTVLFNCSNETIEKQNSSDRIEYIENDYTFVKATNLLEYAVIQKVVNVYEREDSNSVYDYVFVFDNEEIVYANFNIKNNEIEIIHGIKKNTSKFKRIKNDNNLFKILDLENGIFLGDDVANLEGQNKVDASCSGTLMLCSAACVLATGAVAVSDGPLPLMDILAAATYVICNAACVSNYDDCMNSCNCIEP